MTPDQIIEMGAIALAEKGPKRAAKGWHEWPDDWQDAMRDAARVVLEGACPGLLEGTHAVLPLHATEEMIAWKNQGVIYGQMVKRYLGAT